MKYLVDVLDSEPRTFDTMVRYFCFCSGFGRGFYG